MSGDFGVKLNLDADYIVFRHSGHRSKLPYSHIGLPNFIIDPFKKYYQTSELIYPSYSPQPIVGFCGQTDADLINAAKEIAVRIYHRLQYAFNNSIYTPQPIQAKSKLRADLLRKLENDQNISTNFIKRKKYRAGVQSDKKLHQTTIEFYDNILNVQYVLCVRGGGNFSVRFYETLAMGRIPIFVNTDCLLPLADQIDWKKHCVWVEAAEKKHIADKVHQFHQKHTQESLFKLMQSNRKLWKEKMRTGRFFLNQTLKEK